MAGYNKNLLANKQVLDLLAELGRPASNAELADRLRLGYQIVHSRLYRLREAEKVKSGLAEDGKTLMWDLACRDGRNVDGYTRHSPLTALAALERAVRRWHAQGARNGR